MYVTNISALKSGSVPATTEDITVGGYYSENDGGGGSFVWKSGTRPTQDNGFVIYHNSNTSGWFQRLPDEKMVNVRWFGATGDGSTNDFAAFDAVLDLAATSDFIGVFVPAGEYRLNSTLDIFNKTIHLKGESGTEFAEPTSISKLVFASGTPGLKVRRDSGLAAIDSGASVIENIMIESLGHGGGSDEHGLYIDQRTYVTNVTVKAFKNDGFHITGDISSNGTDASLSCLENCRAAGNGDNGFYIQGDDANQCIFTSCDAVDNGEWGFLDESFLGNQYIGCHCNNNTSGPYSVTNINARSSFVGCYSEESATESILSPKCSVIGGLHGTVIKGGNLNILDGTIVMNSNGSEDSFLLSAEPGSTANEFNLSFGEEEENERFMRWVGPEAILFSLNTPNYPRKMTFASTMFKQLFLNNKLVGHVTDITQLQDVPAEGRSYLRGDLVLNSEYDGTNPFGWMCIKNGTYGTYSEGLTVSSIADDQLTLSGETSVIKEGYTIKVNGVVGTVLGTDVISSQTKLSMDAGFTTGSTITFEAPKFKALGAGAGDTSQRPSLTTNDKGFMYYDTDLSAMLTWSGSAWVAFERIGSATKSGNGSTTAFTIAHGLGTTPTYFNVTPKNAISSAAHHLTANGTNITITYASAPASGSNNLSFAWVAKA